ncbi:MAG: glycoside hydrolase family 2 TIM barrel-domain containing protein [Planctomycetia bacterium]|nr:glycoside hydrolase family 2 TIM barrel-domain containing protein [Planctomycetia bacterium]
MKVGLIVPLLFGFILFPGFSFSQETSWGNKPSTAVVNPAVRSPFSKVLSLRGEWDFIKENAARYRLFVGEFISGNRSYDWSHAEKIHVPAPWEVEGIGDPGPGIAWDADWDRGFWDLKHVYMGRAVYRKIVNIPADWNGQIWLKVGGVRSEAYFWVNSQRAAYVNNYCGTEKFNITSFVQPGQKTEITAMVRNDVPSRKGLWAANHRFGGFYRDIELEETPNIWIDDVWVQSDLAKKSALVHIDLDQIPSASSVKGSLDIAIKTLEGKILADQKIPLVSGKNSYTADCSVPQCRFWTPEDPALYLANVDLKDQNGKTIHGWTARFGLRKLEVRGKNFYLNGKPCFLRGGGDHNYDCHWIIEPPDRARFVEHMKIYKAAGFNFMRHHTHCPLPEYFEAADEMGILLMPELPYYHDTCCEGFVFDPLRDLKELYYNYRRYVSFAVYSGGNEGYLGSPIDKKMYQWVRKHDPDRLVLHQDGGNNLPENSDFSTGPIKPWTSGEVNPDRPFIAHEYLNLAIKMNPFLEPRFTGVRVSPISIQKYKDLLNECGLSSEWGKACLAASRKLQAYYQKQGLESARLDPYCDGYAFWSIVDASIPQGSTVAAQGYLNSFWEVRENGLPPEKFHQFNGPTALLLKTDLDLPIVEKKSMIDAQFRISHFGAKDLPGGSLRWKIRTDKNILAAGDLPFESVKCGYVGLLAQTKIAAPKVESPVHAKLEVEIAGSDLRNDWNLWIFPVRAKKSLSGTVVSKDLLPWFEKYYTDVVPYGDKRMKPDDLLIASDRSAEREKGIQEGRPILCLNGTSKTHNVKLGWWGIGTQVGTAMADHSVFGDFPKSPWMDELWFRMIRSGAPDMRIKEKLGSWDPLIVGEGRESYYLYLGQARMGKAKVLSAFALDLMQENPETLALLDRLINYARSPDFDPKVKREP